MVHRPWAQTPNAAPGLVMHSSLEWNYGNLATVAEQAEETRFMDSQCKSCEQTGNAKPRSPTGGRSAQECERLLYH